MTEQFHNTNYYEKDWKVTTIAVDVPDEQNEASSCTTTRRSWNKSSTTTKRHHEEAPLYGHAWNDYNYRNDYKCWNDYKCRNDYNYDYTLQNDDDDMESNFIY